MIMQFNGKWGAWNDVNPNPPGIELHTEWLWPAGSPKNPIPYAGMTMTTRVAERIRADPSVLEPLRLCPK